MTKTNFLNLLSSLRSGGAKTFTLTVDGNAVNMLADGEPIADRIYRGANVAREHDRMKRWLGVWMYENPIPVIKTTDQEMTAIKAADAKTADVLTVGFRYYRFDTSYDDECRAYQDLCADVRQRNGGSYIARQTLGSWNPSKEYQAFHSALQVYGLNNTTIDIDTTHLFKDQFNTPKGVVTANGIRVYLWAEYSYPNAAIKEGYFLIDDQNILKNRLATTYNCGYCGAQYPEAKAAALNYCCDSCISSPLLKLDHIHMLKLIPMIDGNKKRAFDADQLAQVKDAVINAQLQATQTRAAAYFPKKLEELKANHEKALKHLNHEFNAMQWLLNHNISIEDVIYYNHKNLLSFGWRGDGMEPEKAEKLKALLNGFPFEYEIVIKGAK